VAQVECAGYGVASALLGLEGLEVFDVAEGGHNGAREVHVLTAAGVPRLCPHCATPARRPKERVCTVVRDLPQAQTRIELRWHKQRWWCDNPDCARKTFTEAVPQAGPGHRLTARMRTAMAEAVGDQLRPVCEVADTFGVAWHSTHNAFVAHADAVLGTPTPEPAEDGHDWGADSPGFDGAAGPHHDDSPAGGGTPDAAGPAGPADTARAGQQETQALPPVSALGIDDTRRGRRRLRRDPDTG
jgi:hypothetical protein